MQIGLDFDNTIVDYDALFHKVASERGVIPPSMPRSKIAVRDDLRKRGLEDVWTELQGYVYGARMDEAAIYPGVIDFLVWAQEERHSVSIVSHKTKNPFLGQEYDLHRAARNWIADNLCENGVLLVSSSDVFFELTKEDKLNRIGIIGCNVFLDDLPEILLAEGFPADTRKILFDPEGRHGYLAGRLDYSVGSWADLPRCLAA